MSEHDEHGKHQETPEAAQPQTVAEPPGDGQRPASAAAPSRTPATVVPASPQGPIGKRRSVFFVIGISLITLGIYHLYWTYKVFDEMKRHTGNGIGGVLGLVIAIIINPVNWFVMPSEVGNMYARDGRSKPMTGRTGLWNLLLIVGWFVWTAKIQNALNRYWESKEATAI